MHHDHHWAFIGLSFSVAVLGSWTALDLFQRVRNHSGAARLAWLGAASLIMGAAIWSMHFIAMLGFDPGAPVSYDPALTGLSLLLAVGGTGLAFLAASAGRGGRLGLVLAGAGMGLAICAMHYVGMAALRTASSLGYRPGLVLLSAGIAVAAATGALWAAGRDRSFGWRAGAALGLGLAIVGMHYTAMAALILTPAVGADPAAAGTSPLMLAVAVATGSGIILVTALTASVHDQRQSLVEVLDAGGVGYWEYHPRSGRLSASPTARAIVGLPADGSLDLDRWRAMLSPEAQGERDARLARTLATGEDYSAEYRLESGRWVSLRGQARRDARGQVVKLAGVLLDVTDREAAAQAILQSERRQRLLINELNHRVKNTLATILAIAGMTARRARSIDGFTADFEARVIALSATHNVLTAEGWEHASVRKLLEQELQPYGPHQLSLSGPELDLPAEQALAMGLVLHELTTNAVKYGALSTPDGRVIVTWGLDDEEVVLEWREEGGPLVTAPDRSGFGSRLIRTSVERSLQGSLETMYRPGGLETQMRFRLQRPSHGGPP